MAGSGNVRDRLNDIEITSEEVSKLQEALKNEEFRKLLIEYSNEIKSPENRAIYESEIAELERANGIEVEFIEPSGHYVLKTWAVTGGKKIMINICSNVRVQEPSSKRNNEKEGEDWEIPYMIGCFRHEVDRKKHFCDVIDIIFHPRTLEISHKSPAFRKLVHSTALDATEGHIKTPMNRQNLKFPKLKYKGDVQKCLLRHSKTISDNSPAEPKYELVYRENSLGVRTALVVHVKLPLLSSTAECGLDVTDTSLLLNHEKYHLEMTLPMKVDSDNGKATFDNSTKTLMVELPTYKSSHADLTVPLTNNAINNKLQGVGTTDAEINDMINNCEAMVLDSNTSDETADSTDSEGHKEPTEKVSNDNDARKSSVDDDDDEVFKRPASKKENINKVSMATGESSFTDNHKNKGNILEKKEDGESQELDNETLNNNYYTNNKNKKHRQEKMKVRSFSESSDDYSLGMSPCKGILKYGSSLSNCLELDQLESAESVENLKEGGSEGMAMEQLDGTPQAGSSSIKKSVSFSDVISKQLFRPDSSILGQKKKNQRRAKNKRKSQVRRQTSESEDVNSENEVTVEKPVNVEFASDLMFDIDDM